MHLKQSTLLVLTSKLPNRTILSSSHQVSIPRYQLSMYGRWAFSVAGPTVWNSLPEDMRDLECSVTVTDSH